MKIVKLTAENIKKLVAVEITPTGDVVTITGKNGQGKTSVLDSIWWALAGTTSIQKQPIRRGQESARIRLDLEDGSLLDEDSLAQIATMAQENEYQIWIERVDTSGKVGIVIEDGAVKP